MESETSVIGADYTISKSYIPSSQSSAFIPAKSAFPTPTMMTDMGRWEARIRDRFVSTMSVSSPSVSISRMKYCCNVLCSVHV